MPYSWFTITEAMTDPGAPGTAELWKAWWKNPLAISEGHTDAPVICAEWHPYNKVTNGDANTGLYYDFAVSGAVSSIVTPDFSDGWEYRLVISGIQHSGGASHDFEIDLYRETSASYAGSLQLLQNVPGSAQVFGYADLHACRASRRFHIIDNSTAGGSVGPTSYVLKSDLSSAQKVLKAKLSFPTENITGGKLYLYRRKAFYI